MPPNSRVRAGSARTDSLLHRFDTLLEALRPRLVQDVSLNEVVAENGSAPCCDTDSGAGPEMPKVTVRDRH